MSHSVRERVQWLYGRITKDPVSCLSVRRPSSCSVIWSSGTWPRCASITLRAKASTWPRFSHSEKPTVHGVAWFRVYQRKSWQTWNRLSLICKTTSPSMRSSSIAPSWMTPWTFCRPEWLDRTPLWPWTFIALVTVIRLTNSSPTLRSASKPITNSKTTARDSLTGREKLRRKSVEQSPSLACNWMRSLATKPS